MAGNRNARRTERRGTNGGWTAGLRVGQGEAAAERSVRGRAPWLEVWRRFRRNPIALASLVLVILVYFTGVFAPLLAPYSYSDQNLDVVRQAPSLAHWLGTDDFGRDLLSRIIWGARTAAIVSVVAVFLATVIGIVLGALSGYVGGWVDTAVMRIADILFAFPSLLFVIFVAATLKPAAISFVEQMEAAWGMKGLARSGIVDYIVVFTALSVVAWAGMARLVRGQVLSVKEMEFVTAANAIGAGTLRVVFRHVMPNCLSPVLVAVSMAMGGAVISEATLSYLGIGIQPPNASWGGMISENRDMWRIQPYLIFLPGAVVTIVMLAYNFIGDALNDALNPRGR